jgi:ABC-2 type transport system permease protein
MLGRQAIMFAQIVGFELRYHMRQRSTYVYFVIFGLLGWLVAIGDAKNANVRVTLNAPIMVAWAMRNLSVLGLFIPLAILAHAALRDQRTKMDELIRATPVAIGTYLLGRFAGAFAVSVVVFCGAFAGMAVGTRMWWIDPAVVGSFRYGSYLSAMAIIALPNLFFAGALFFTTASLTRSTMATYLVLIALLVGHLASLALGDPAMRWLASLIDPIGRFAIEDVTRYWTLAERGTQFIPFTGVLALNRLVCVGIGAALLALSMALYRRRAPAGRPPRAIEAASRSATTVRTRRVPVASSGGAGIWAQFISCVRQEAGAILRSWTFLALLVLGVAGCIAVLANLGENYGTPLLPMTHVVVNTLTQACYMLLLVLVVLFSTEIVWRERQAGIAEIVDATPVPSFVFLAAKLVAVTLMLLAILAAAMAVGISYQLAKGVTRINVHFYLVNLFVLLGLQMVMIAVMATFVQALVNQKYVGLVVVLILVIVLPLTVEGFEARVPLLHFATYPDVPLSDMNQFGHFLPAAFWFLAYWGCVSLLIGVATHALWIRGVPASLWARLRGMRAVMTPAVTAVAVFAATGTVAIGAHIYWNTRVLNPDLSAAEMRQRGIDYEKAYRQFEALPQPRVTEVEMDVDLYPETRSFVSRGRYVLVNRSDAPIEAVHVRFDYDVSVDKVELSDSTVIDAQPRFNHFVFRPATPLRPDEARTLTFVASKHRKGFKGQADYSSVLFNGTFVRNNELAPSIGVASERYLQDEKQRKAHGLVPFAQTKLDEKILRNRGHWAGDSDFIRFAITLSTSADQIALAPGYVEREWSAEGRRYFRYAMDTPILNFWSVLSARYAVARDKWNDVDIAIYFHPGHETNVLRMIDAVKESLAYYSANFGPYQHRQMRIVEFPGYFDFAQSFPNTVPYSEGAGFITDNRNPDLIDYVWYLTAHEVAHQWWGHQVAGAAVPGEGFLSEALAQYSSLMVMERRYGAAHMRRFLSYELDKYLSGRGLSRLSEPPLARAEGQGHIRYNKGAVAMYALKDAVGEATVNRVLAQLVREHGLKTNPYTTAMDFIRLLRKEVGKEHQQLVTDLFERITLWDLQVVGSEARPTDDGKWRVRVDVQARKLVADAGGSEKEAPLNQAIDIGLFTADPRRSEFSEKDVIRLEKHRIVGGKQSIELVVDRKPLFVGIDPYIKLIQRNTTNNVAPLAPAGTATAEKTSP